ncbi:MAG: DUF1822 family protein [Cyanobacteria bacterium J06631_2]
MNTSAKCEVFQANIPLIAHVQAEKFRRYQSVGSKAKQVYLNTLAIFVAKSYLNMIGWSANLEESECWNPIAQTMLNIADLQISGYGRIECRVVRSKQSEVIVPPEVWSGRIGYLVILLDEALETAKILGFARQIKQLEFSLTQLESLREFPSYLSQQKRVEPISSVGLSSWMRGALDCGWQNLDELFAPSVAMSFRSKQKLAEVPFAPVSESRVKLAKLGKDSEHTIALILNIQPVSTTEFNVSVKVSNYKYDCYLPEGLELVIIDRHSHSVMVAQANEMETIEFCFSGELEENFAVEISLNDEFVVENFTI